MRRSKVPGPKAAERFVPDWRQEARAPRNRRRHTRSYNAGNISKGAENKIKAKARAKLGKKGK